MAACLVLSSLVACAGVMPKATTPDLKSRPEIRPDFRADTRRACLHEYSITFAAEVDLAASAIARRGGAAPAGRNAVLWRAGATASMQSDLHTSAAAADRLAASAEGLPEVELSERRIAEETRRQHALVMEASSVERAQAVDRLVRGFATEGSALLRSVDEQRLATLEWATAERRETIAEIQRELAASIEAIRGERAVAMNELRDIIDLELLRVALFLVAAVVLAPFVAHAYARVWPRR